LLAGPEEHRGRREIARIAAVVGLSQRRRLRVGHQIAGVPSAHLSWFVHREGLLRGRIVIPIHNASGELIAYAGPAIDGQEPKYRFPAGFRKSLVLFNLHRAIATNGKTMIAVEGFFDTIAVHQRS